MYIYPYFNYVTEFTSGVARTQQGAIFACTQVLSIHYGEGPITAIDHFVALTLHHGFSKKFVDAQVLRTSWSEDLFMIVHWGDLRLPIISVHHDLAPFEAAVAEICKNKSLSKLKVPSGMLRSGVAVYGHPPFIHDAALELVTVYLKIPVLA